MSQVYRPGDAVVEVGVGAILGERYRLVERIGMGGMATIYRAVDERLERDVAVKVLHAHLADDEHVLARFRSEGQHAAALAHSHIVAVYDQGAGAVPFLVMERVDGPSLREVLHARGRLTPQEALAVIVPVCMALRRAHAAGVVHRDVKPENVLITREGVPKVADFGIARALEGTHYTETGTLIGSVHYLAPELVGGGEATPASDQYAVGVLAFELLTGRKALTADTPMAVALRHTRERIPAPSAYVADVSEALDDVIARATDPDPDARFADIAAFAGALIQAVPGGPKPVLVPTGGPDEETLVIPATPEAGSNGDREFPTAGVAAAHGRRMRRRRRRAVRRGSRRRGRTIAVVAALVLGLLALTAGSALAVWHYAIAPVQEVPSLAGLGESEAGAALDELGLLLVIAGSEHAVDVPAGSVLTQQPAAGTELRRGGAVEVVLSAGPATVEMPEVVGTDRADAEALLAAEPYHLEITGVEERHHHAVPAGQVLEQVPDAGEDVLQGAAVELVVSAGPGTVEMPEVVGTDRADAEALLAAEPYHLEIAEVSERFDDHAPAGMVVEQAPGPGEELLQGDAVELVVSLGIEQVEVPDLAGLTRAEAEAALGDARLAAAFIEEYSDDVPTPGRVAGQAVAPGSQVDKGATVRVTISRGPLTFPLPRVEGKTVEEAEAELRALDLAVQVIKEPLPRIGPFRRGEYGFVEAQNPQPDESVQRGQRVDLYTFAPDEELAD